MTAPNRASQVDYLLRQLPPSDKADALVEAAAMNKNLSSLVGIVTKAVANTNNAQLGLLIEQAYNSVVAHEQTQLPVLDLFLENCRKGLLNSPQQHFFRQFGVEAAQTSNYRQREQKKRKQGNNSTISSLVSPTMPNKQARYSLRSHGSVISNDDCAYSNQGKKSDESCSLIDSSLCSRSVNCKDKDKQQVSTRTSAHRTSPRQKSDNDSCVSSLVFSSPQKTIQKTNSSATIVSTDDSTVAKHTRRNNYSKTNASVSSLVATTLPCNGTDNATIVSTDDSQVVAKRQSMRTLRSVTKAKITDNLKAATATPYKLRNRLGDNTTVVSLDDSQTHQAKHQPKLQEKSTSIPVHSTEFINKSSASCLQALFNNEKQIRLWQTFIARLQLQVVSRTKKLPLSKTTARHFTVYKTLHEFKDCNLARFCKEFKASFVNSLCHEDDKALCTVEVVVVDDCKIWIQICMMHTESAGFIPCMVGVASSDSTFVAITHNLPIVIQRRNTSLCKQGIVHYFVQAYNNAVSAILYEQQQDMMDDKLTVFYSLRGTNAYSLLNSAAHIYSRQALDCHRARIKAPDDPLYGLVKSNNNNTDSLVQDLEFASKDEPPSLWGPDCPDRQRVTFSYSQTLGKDDSMSCQVTYKGSNVYRGMQELVKLGIIDKDRIPGYLKFSACMGNDIRVQDGDFVVPRE